MPEMTDAEREAMEAAIERCRKTMPEPQGREAERLWHAAREFSRREPPSSEVAQKRLVLLATATRAELDSQREETGVDEWDEGDPRCYLYNAVEAILDRDANASYSGPAAAEKQIDDCLEQAQPLRRR